MCVSFAVHVKTGQPSKQRPACVPELGRELADGRVLAPTQISSGRVRTAAADYWRTPAALTCAAACVQRPEEARNRHCRRRDALFFGRASLSRANRGRARGRRGSCVHLLECGGRRELVGIPCLGVRRRHSVLVRASRGMPRAGRSSSAKSAGRRRALHTKAGGAVLWRRAQRDLQADGAGPGSPRGRSPTTTRPASFGSGTPWSQPRPTQQCLPNPPVAVTVRFAVADG